MSTLAVQLADDTIATFEAVARFMTDETNNLCIFHGAELAAMYAAGHWRSVLVTEEG